jgi:hypothetical protein
MLLKFFKAKGALEPRSQKQFPQEKRQPVGHNKNVATVIHHGENASRQSYVSFFLVHVCGCISFDFFHLCDCERKQERLRS